MKDRTVLFLFYLSDEETKSSDYTNFLKILGLEHPLRYPNIRFGDPYHISWQARPLHSLFALLDSIALSL